MKKAIVIALITLQLIFISFLIVRLAINYQHQNISVNPLNSATQSFYKTGKLKYFHEPKGTGSYKLADKTTVEDTINSDGLKNTKDYTVLKDKNVIRIIAMGDSFTYGLHVSTKDIWPEKLESMLNSKLSCSGSRKFEVINLGVPGYDISYSLERYMLRGKKYDPDLVVWMVLDNDLDIIEEELSPLMQKNKEILSLDVPEDSFNFNVDKNGNFHNYYISLYLKSINEFERLWKKEDILDFQLEKLKSFNNYFKKTLLLYGVEQALDKKENIETFEKFAKTRKNTIFYRETGGEKKWFEHVLPDHHPDSEGHSIIAQNILDYLIKQKVLDVTCR